MYKVNYLKKWDKEGTFYNQTLTLSKEKICVNSINELIECEKINNKNYINDAFLKPFKIGINYCNLTQVNFISKLLCITLKDRNTIVIIK